MVKTRAAESDLLYPNLPPHHWKNRRSAAVNTDKRVAYGCNIDKKNEQRSTRRRRVPVSYNEKDLFENVCEYNKILVTEKKAKIRKPMSDISNKLKKKKKATRKATQAERRRSSNLSYDIEDEYDMEEENEPMEEAKSEVVKEEVKVVSRKNVQRKKRRSSIEIGEDPLHESAKKALAKFGGKLSQEAMHKTPAEYRGVAVPRAIREFSAMCLSLKNNFINKQIMHDNLFGQMVFGVTGLVDEEWNDLVKGTKSDKWCIIGSGDVLLLADITDTSSDFSTTIVDDKEGYCRYGPFKISKVLANIEIDEE